MSRSLVVAAMVAVCMPLAMHAQEQSLGTYNGRVDKEVRITIHGGDVSSNTLSGTEMRSRYRIMSPLPMQEGTVRVAVNAGRGDVSVIQQPNASNNYTAIIRLYDRSGGADVYRLATYFTPSHGTTYGRRGPGGILGRTRRDNLPMIHWSGDVDGTIELRWRGGNVQTRTLNGRPARAVAVNQSGDVAAVENGSIQNAQVTVQAREGRGTVEVVQQPSAANRYTTVIRITDPARGYGHYDLNATWR